MERTGAAQLMEVGFEFMSDEYNGGRKLFRKRR
jgi:hypothetical protein